MKYLIETKNIVCIFLNLWIYVGFHSCLHKWCIQSGTNQQYTKCERVSQDGRTCYNPTIKYGYTTGGYPVKHHTNNYQQWCQQLFTTRKIISSSVTYTNTYPTNFIGALFWCTNYEQSEPHWCDWLDGNWRNQRLGPYKYLPIINSLTCVYQKGMQWGR